jgi:hypothetical protein
MAKPRVSLLRTLGLTLALAAPVAAALYLEREFRLPAEAGDGESLLPEPWLELPGEPLPFRAEATRMSAVALTLLERDFHDRSAPPFDIQFSELSRCDSRIVEVERERHQLWIAEAWADTRWLQLRIGGDEAHLDEHVLVQRPAPPPTQEDDLTEHAAEASETLARGPRRTLSRIPLVELEALRSAWSDPSLWKIPNAQILHAGCFDGRQVVLASCVSGELEIRLHQCSDAEDVAIDELLRQFDALLETAEAPLSH